MVILPSTSCFTSSRGEKRGTYPSKDKVSALKALHTSSHVLTGVGHHTHLEEFASTKSLSCSWFSGMERSREAKLSCFLNEATTLYTLTNSSAF